MTHKQHRPTFFRYFTHFPERLLLKRGISDRQHLVNDQDFWLEVGSNREGKPHIHAAGVAFDRRVQKPFDFGKTYDFIKPLPYLTFAHSKNGTIQVNILPTSQLGMETGTYF